MWTWYVDRAAALLAYAILWLVVLTGIAHRVRALGALQRAAKAAHVPASVLATVALLLHVATGIADSVLVFARRVPHPAYTDAAFATGILVGVVSLLILVTATLAFLDPRRFERPWDPRLIHAFAYAGFAFATIHAIAIGTDAKTFLLPPLVASTALLLFALLLRFGIERISTRPKAPEGDPRSGPSDSTGTR